MFCIIKLKLIIKIMNIIKICKKNAKIIILKKYIKQPVKFKSAVLNLLVMMDGFF